MSVGASGDASVNRPFADCKTDELHLASSIQSFGGMLVVGPDDTVVAASANAEAFFGYPPQGLLGVDARAVLPAGVDLDAARAEVDGGAAPAGGSVDAPVRIRLRATELAGRPATLAVHARAGNVFVEAQRTDGDDISLGDAADVVQRVSDRLEGVATPEAAASLLLDAIAHLVGFDRAMAYRFLPGWHGEVLDERLAPGMESYRGLRFPAGDIPANARRLYRVKRQRIIADVNDATVPVLGAREGMTLDLTGSELRAVHPVHLEYLRNMGVAASFSVSIVAHGRLWGMVACHHRTPRNVGFVRRQACEMVATIASLHVANLDRVAHMAEQAQHRIAREWARSEIEHDEGLDLGAVLPRLREAFRADGALARLDGRTFRVGDVPDGDASARLVDVFGTWPDDAVTAGSSVPAELADDPEVVRAASGVLYVPLGRDAFVALLRREEAAQIAWAGRPPEEDAEGARLGPRASFAIWREATRGQAAEWSPADVESAEWLRAMLLEEIERAELSRLATTDELTGLANRAAFDAALRAALEDDGRGTALLMVDLDGFKGVNDDHGHPVGDRLLEHVADRLRQAVRDRDVAARFGGDEFGIVLHDVADATALAGTAARVVRAIGEAYHVDGRRLEVSTSVGAAFAIGPFDTPEALLERADRALYAAKRGGKNGYALASEAGGARDDDGGGAAEGSVAPPVE